VASLAELSRAHPGRAILATRCDEPTRAACRTQLPEASIDDVAQTVVLGPLPAPRGTVAVVTAGTSDLPVAREAVVTAQVFGSGTVLLADLGVAGLHRLLAELDTLAAADAIVAVAGTDGALPGVIAGLVAVPVLAVPTSVGYGASLGGVAALLTMLNACAPGVSVVNIDNGFGAAVSAARIARRLDRAP
jgi:pyridinium-3,5-biscarboxylic acid mononucleotide synthase